MRSGSETNSDSDCGFCAGGVAGGVGSDSVARTVFKRQSMGGLTRSSHGIPKMMEWEPIGATRKVSRCLTFAMVYDKVVCRVARVSNSPFARLTEVGMHGFVSRDNCWTTDSWMKLRVAPLSSNAGRRFADIRTDR